MKRERLGKEYIQGRRRCKEEKEMQEHARGRGGQERKDKVDSKCTMQVRKIDMHKKMKR